MRIISGDLKGLNFSAPKNARTHPMSDRVRGGLFNALGDIEGLDILDAFAGSGALSIEAVSRRAKSATAIEADPKAFKAIKDNTTQLGLTNKIKASQAYVKSWLNTNPDKTYDIIMCCPPYDNLNLPTIHRLPPHLKPAGIMVLDWPGNEPLIELDTLQIVKNKNYGDAQLVFYKKIS